MKKIIVMLMLAITMLLCGCETHSTSKTTMFTADEVIICEYYDDVKISETHMSYAEYTLMKD